MIHLTIFQKLNDIEEIIHERRRSHYIELEDSRINRSANLHQTRRRRKMRKRCRNWYAEGNRRKSKHKGRNGETVERGSRRGDGELVGCVIFRGYKLCTGINRRRCWPQPPPAGCSSPSCSSIGSGWRLWGKLGIGDVRLRLK